MNQHLKTPRLTWLGMTNSVVIYVVIVFMLAKDWEGPNEDLDLNLFLLVFGAVSVLLALGSLLIKRFLYFGPHEGKGLEPSRAAELYYIPFIVSLALAEAIGIFGFVLSFLSQQTWPVFPFAAVALVIMLSHFPRESHLTRVTDTSGASSPEGEDAGGEGTAW